MSQFRYTYRLIQHTPLIHFQPEQAGATLRATELKPRFDAFIKKRRENLDTRFHISDTDALDYKVFIKANRTKPTPIDKRDPLYFGNIGEGNKKFIQAKSLEVTFFSYHRELLDIIDKYFEPFLANTNFGTRKSKGYGSFYLDKEFHPNLIDATRVCSFKAKENWKNDIKLFYSLLRQGINYPNKFYAKSLIWLYGKQRGWNWEKKKIKEVFFSGQLRNQKDKYCQTDRNSPLCYDGGNYYILRDLFGLSTDQTWMSYKKANIKKEHPTIKRFPSPLQFKPIKEKDDFRVYFWVLPFYKDLLNQTFTIKYNWQSFNLSTPSDSDFDFDQFLDFALKVDLSKHIDSSYHNTNEFSTLQRIFNSIRIER